MSLEQTEAECAANATAPRVSLTDIEAAIEHRLDMSGSMLAFFAGHKPRLTSEEPTDPLLETMGVLSVCFLIMKNGFVVIGKSAPASPENFNAELGKKLAYEDAVRQLWPLFGFALRETLMRRAAIADQVKADIPTPHILWGTSNPKVVVTDFDLKPRHVPPSRRSVLSDVDPIVKPNQPDGTVRVRLRDMGFVGKAAAELGANSPISPEDIKRAVDRQVADWPTPFGHPGGEELKPESLDISPLLIKAAKDVIDDIGGEVSSMYLADQICRAVEMQRLREAIGMEPH